MNSLTQEQFLDICHSIDELYNNVRVDFIGDKEIYSQAVYDQVLVEDYIYAGLAQCIYLNIVPYDTLTDEAITAVMELYSDYVALGYIR
jgi:hypothetical protein